MKTMTTPQFLETFTESDFSEQNSLCELYLHEMDFMMESQYNPIPHLGDIHLREFTSFVTNHMHWWVPSATIHRNEDNSTLWIHGETRVLVPLISRYKKHLSSPEKVNQLVAFRKKVISTCVNLISRQEAYSLKGSSHGWEVSPISLK